MRGIRGRTWLLYAVVGGVAAALVAGGLVWSSAGRARQRTDNLEQLEHACAGLLPHEQLRDFVPADSAGVLDEYGTMLDPDQESRALLNCTLAWGPGRWEPDALVRVRAEALVAAQAGGAGSVYDFPFPLPSGVRGSTTSDGRLHGSEVRAHLRVDCPRGVRGRSLPSKGFDVSVKLPSKQDREYDVSDAEYLLVARTAVDVANWVIGRQDCGRGPIGTDASPHRVEGPTPTELCAWIDPEELRFAGGDWTFSGDGAYDGRAGYCAGSTTGFGYPADLPVEELRAESWSGEFARGAYERYSRAGAAPTEGPRSPGAKDGGVVLDTEEFPRPQLALWAKSQCDGGPSYHRIAVTPALDAGRERDVVVEAGVRRRFSTDAQAALDRYLTAGGSWPQRAHCHDTEVLGEVEEWSR
ncbi:hypothetical protein [Streptomyces sp. NRRL WC-3549]|uniref:hypothetical protein n=1 Tax=Streptomyces sp. NRRL WC-3549 TaxID=1463925 RepID=UPI0004C8978E|nr:hypothetical protein [Streptomyces sp. NRRL WC-3549]